MGKKSVSIHMVKIYGISDSNATYFFNRDLNIFGEIHRLKDYTVCVFSPYLKARKIDPDQI